jgi:hypothetical protein
MDKLERQITKTNYSYSVTLPLEWIRNNKLQSGSILEVGIRKNGTLVIRPTPDATVRKGRR